MGEKVIGLQKPATRLSPEHLGQTKRATTVMTQAKQANKHDEK
jgi:hypothetical protein